MSGCKVLSWNAGGGSPPLYSGSSPDFELQADRQGRAPEFAAAFAKSDLAAMADAEIERQLKQASELGEG